MTTKKAETPVTINPEMQAPKIENMPLPNEQKIHGMGLPIATASTISPFNSFLSTLKESMKNIIDVAPEVKTISESVFTHMDDESTDDNVFLNVPNLIQILVLMAAVSHTEPSQEIKTLLLRLKKTDSTKLTNGEMTRLTCTRAARDFMAWDLNIRHQCMYNEYQTRRRLYVNHLICRSFAFRTFQALNSLLMEVKLSSVGGIKELDAWAMGPEKFPPDTKNIFKIWNYQEEQAKNDEAETKKEKIKKTPLPSAIKGKLKVNTKESTKVPACAKCPIIMTTTHFEIPIHPFILDMRHAYTMGKWPALIRALRFINDESKMLKYYKIGADHRGVKIPCRLKEDDTNMQLMIFWSAQKTKHYYNILTLVDAVVGGPEMATKINGEVQQMQIEELHLPMWDPSYESSNLAHSIAERVTGHLFAEDGFGDLAPSKVRPTAEANGVEAPSIQAFDHLFIRTPVEEGLTPKDLDTVRPEGKQVIRVSLPYYMVIYDDKAKCPLYLVRISKPLLEKDRVEEVVSKWNKYACTIL